MKQFWNRIPMGTRSVLIGAHCFFLHPWFVAAAWWKLFGFPWDPRLWVAFFVHDLGYIGKRAMDDEDGETHPLLGAFIMGLLFDRRPSVEIWERSEGDGWSAEHLVSVDRDTRWHDFSLLHSRYYAKRLGKPFSRLCLADKLSFALTPRWLYLPMVNLTGEIHEYLGRAKTADTKAGHFKAADYSARQKEWHVELCRYMRSWVEAHKHEGAVDTWTSADRHADKSGVWR